MERRDWMTMIGAAFLAPLCGLALASLLVADASVAGLAGGTALGWLNGALAILSLRLGLGRGDTAFWHFAVGLNGLRALGMMVILGGTSFYRPEYLPAFACVAMSAIWLLLIVEVWCLHRHGLNQIALSGELRHG